MVENVCLGTTGDKITFHNVRSPISSNKPVEPTKEVSHYSFFNFDYNHINSRIPVFRNNWGLISFNF